MPLPECLSPPNEDGNLPWGAPTPRVTQPFGQVVMRDRVANWNHRISTTTMSIGTKPCRVVTSMSGFHSQLNITRWSDGLERSCYKLRPLYLHYLSASGHQTWQGGKLQRGASTYKVTWHFARSRDKLKPLYLHSHYAHDHQTWKGGNLYEGLPPIALNSPLIRWSWKIMW